MIEGKTRCLRTERGAGGGGEVWGPSTMSHLKLSIELKPRPAPSHNPLLPQPYVRRPPQKVGQLVDYAALAAPSLASE